MKRAKELEPVVLLKDLPEFNLRVGHIGIVVLVYDPDAVEVEFVDREGDTVALLTLMDRDVRVADESDLRSQTWPDPLPRGAEAPIADATGLAPPVS